MEKKTSLVFIFLLSIFLIGLISASFGYNYLIPKKIISSSCTCSSNATNTSYVPYTGANQNVNLGIYNITAPWFKAASGFVVNGNSGITGNYTILKDANLVMLTKTYCFFNITGGIITGTNC